MTIDKKTQGAWIIHHTDKLQGVKDAANDYDSINLAGRCGLLLSNLAASDEQFISEEKLQALAKAAKINRIELPGILEELKKQKLIASISQGVRVLGLTTAATLEYTATIFNDANPKKYELAVIDLSEKTSELPLDDQTAKEYIEDTYKLTTLEASELLSVAEQIGFIDIENVDNSRRMIFNGNLFRRNEIQKINAICSSLSESNIRKIRELDDMLKGQACVSIASARQILDNKLFGRLQSIGLYDVSSVINEQGDFSFVTKPSAFSKFGNAAVEDAFDLAKVFVTSLTFGMTQSELDRGKITMIEKLMRRLISGAWVGPATAIGHDYKVLELRGVLQVKPSQQHGNRFEMKLLKKDIGELALKVITSGDISAETILSLPSASIISYTSPEQNRTYERKSQTPQIQSKVGELLDVLRTGM